MGLHTSVLIEQKGFSGSVHGPVIPFHRSLLMVFTPKMQFVANFKSLHMTLISLSVRSLIICTYPIYDPTLI